MGVKLKLTTISKWPAPSKLPASIPEPSTQESTSLTRLLPRRPPAPVASRSPTDSDQEPLLSVRSEDSRRAPSSSSESFHSRDSSVRSPLSTEASSASSPAPSLPSSWPLRGHQPLRHPRQESHHHAKGHAARPQNPWRALLNAQLTRVRLLLECHFYILAQIIKPVK